MQDFRVNSSTVTEKNICKGENFLKPHPAEENSKLPCHEDAEGNNFIHDMNVSISREGGGIAAMDCATYIKVAAHPPEMCKPHICDKITQF